jgi:biopolymer transport protein TolR
MVAGNDRKGPLMNLNVTPLIDVLLVLIIIFMVITPQTPRGLKAFVTHPSHDANLAALMISLDAAGNIRINQDEVQPSDFVPRLEEILRTRAGRSIFLKCDSSLAFSKVAGIMDLAKSAGIEEIALVTDEFAGRQ